MGFQEVVYRPVFGRVLAVITMAVCAAGVVAVFFTDAVSGLRYVWPILLVATVAWAVFWRPSLRVEEHGITVENVFCTFFVPWPAIQQIDTRYSLTLQTSRRRVTVWAAPAPGRHRTLGLASKDFDGVTDTARGEHGDLRPADAITTPTGNLAQLIRGHWEGLGERGLLALGEEPEAETVTWHRVTIGVLAVLTAATLIGLLV
jgi:hypothetical protein